MAAHCQTVHASGLSLTFTMDCFGRSGGVSQIVKEGGSTGMVQSSRRNWVTCCSKTSRPSECMNITRKHTRDSAWWEGIGTAATGAFLSIGISASCLAWPALADFLSFDHAELRGRDMSGQDLHGAVFAACDCRKINLKGSNLDGSTDTFAGFQGSNLENSSWVRAFADRVVFRDANLENANFTDAVLSGSQFDGADITGADFTDALLDNYQRLKMCKKAKGVNPTTGVETRESLFC